MSIRCRPCDRYLKPRKNLATREEKQQIIIQRIIKGMKEQGVNRFTLSKLMHVEPSRITKLLSAQHNSNLKTLFLLEEVLDIQIINVLP